MSVGLNPSSRNHCIWKACFERRWECLRDLEALCVAWPERWCCLCGRWQVEDGKVVDFEVPEYVLQQLSRIKRGETEGSHDWKVLLMCMTFESCPS